MAGYLPVLANMKYMKERHFVCTEHQIQPDFGVWHLLIAWVCRQPADGKLACFANTPSGPLVTPSLQEFGTGDGQESIEVLLTNLEGFWLLGVEMVMEEEEVVEKEVDNFEVVVVNLLLVEFGTGVSNKLLLPPSLQSVPPTSTSPSASTLRVL